MKVHTPSKPASDMRAMVEVAVPAGPCTPGFTQVLATTCDKTGEAYGAPDWVDPVELEQSVGVEGRRARAGKCGGCAGAGAPAVDVVAVFNAGKEAFRDGVLLGIDLASSGRAASYIPKYAAKRDAEELNRKIEKASREMAADGAAFTNEVIAVAKKLPTAPEAQ